MPGFGAKTQQQVLDATALHLHASRRVRLSVASQVADALLSDLEAVHGVQQAVAAGSLRRSRETVGDIDLLVTVRGGSASVMQRFTTAPDVRSVIAKGTTRASVVLRSGLQVDLRAVSPSGFGAACRMAKNEGVPVSIATDAHSAAGFAHFAFGVGQARRGWLEAMDVLNARPLAQLRPLLDRAMGRPGHAGQRALTRRGSRAPAPAQAG